MQHRRRVKHVISFEERLAKLAKHLRDQAKRLPLGKQREELFRKARQVDAACSINEWLTSPGLRPPDGAAELSTKIGGPDERLSSRRGKASQRRG
jgi:hypothetical protein